MKYIITGASSGLGYCLAERLIEQGEVAGVSRSQGRSKLLLDSGKYVHIQYDFSQSLCESNSINFINRLKSFVDDEPFTLVLNAASFYASVTRMSTLSLAELFNVNVFSLMNLVRQLQDPNLRRIFIVNSVSGIIGQSQQHEYSASKHAVMGFARSLAKSAKYSEYDVMCINPGGMKTELWAKHNDVDCSDFLSPDTVADVCVNLISIPQRTFIEQMSILPPSDV